MLKTLVKNGLSNKINMQDKTWLINLSTSFDIKSFSYEQNSDLAELMR